jgi:hypothetical protein
VGLGLLAWALTPAAAGATPAINNAGKASQQRQEETEQEGERGQSPLQGDCVGIEQETSITTKIPGQIFTVGISFLSLLISPKHIERNKCVKLKTDMEPAACHNVNEAVRYVTEIGPNDVLLGRGNPVIKNPGEHSNCM